MMKEWDFSSLTFAVSQMRFTERIVRVFILSSGLVLVSLVDSMFF